MKVLISNYTFNKTAKTVTFTDFTAIALHRILLITNTTTGEIIYNFADPTKGGTVATNVLTLAFDTSAMSNSDKLQIYYDLDTITEKVVEDSAAAVQVAARPQTIKRISFTKAVSNGVDSEWGVLVGSIGTGQDVNQTGGNLVITSGTTARAETIIRSNNAFKGGIRLRARSTLSQRIANNNFFVELVDVIGDGLAYTINSAVAITVTIPNNPFTSANVGQSVYLGGFSGSGTFLSGRYPIASVSGNDVTFTVSGFAAGTGTVSLFGWNYYQLLYTGTTATQSSFDTQRKGYASGATTASNSTTASPGHIAIITGNDMSAIYSDQLVASSAAVRQTIRASRDENVPDDVELKVQIRVANGSTNPASTTTWTIGYVSVSNYSAMDTVVQDTRQSTNTPIPVDILRAVSLPVTNSPASNTSYSLVTTASTNAAVIKSSVANWYEVTISNPTATPAYVKFYSKATAPTVGTDVPILTVPIEANSTKTIEFGTGKRVPLGLGIAVTGAIAANDTSNAVAGVQIHASYA